MAFLREVVTSGNLQQGDYAVKQPKKRLWRIIRAKGD